MFSDNFSICQLASLMLDAGIHHVVTTPGSRNAPLLHTFASHSGFTCYSIVDERSAAFFALGLIQKLQTPVAICCTSGTALLNFSSAVAEAFYQNLPLLVLSADRPSAWINQMDGQTIPQQGVYNFFVKRSIQLPEGLSEEDKWFCNRRINEALLALLQTTVHGIGGNSGCAPVHINIPLSEPLFSFSTEQLPKARRINITASPPQVSANEPYFSETWKHARKKMIIIGQRLPQNSAENFFLALSKRGDCIVLSEHLANTEYGIHDIDTILASAQPEELKDLVPDIVITCEGHIVSKRLKQLLRTHKPTHHWHLSPDGACPDIFQSLTEVIVTTPLPFLASLPAVEDTDTSYFSLWNYFADRTSKRFNEFIRTACFSDLYVLNSIVHRIPEGSSLHIANSSPVRNIQHFQLPKNVHVFCNRGTNGIDGSLSSAVGYACLHEALTFVLIGDLSFFYDANALWNKYINQKLRILLFNNGGGAIFHTLPGLRDVDSLGDYVACHHQTSAKEWASSLGIEYLTASTSDNLEQCIGRFTARHDSASTINRATILEVKTSIKTNTAVNQDLYRYLR